MRHLEIKLGRIAVYTIISENRVVLRSRRRERWPELFMERHTIRLWLTTWWQIFPIQLNEVIYPPYIHHIFAEHGLGGGGGSAKIKKFFPDRMISI